LIWFIFFVKSNIFLYVTGKGGSWVCLKNKNRYKGGGGGGGGGGDTIDQIRKRGNTGLNSP